MNSSRVAAIFGNGPLIELLDYLLRGVGSIPGTFSAGFSAATVTAPADTAAGAISSYVITICKGTMSPFEQIAVAFTGRVTADNNDYAILSVNKYHNGAYVSTVGTLSSQLNTYEANTSYDLALTPGVTYADGDVLVLSVTKHGAGVALPNYSLSGRLATPTRFPGAQRPSSPLRCVPGVFYQIGKHPFGPPHLHVPTFVVGDQQRSSSGAWQQSWTAFSHVSPLQ